MAANAWATSGWNWLPALSRSSCTASALAERRPIGARRGHRVEAVGHDQHVGFDGDVALRHRVVAAAVVALVVELGVERHLLGEMERRQQPRREPWVAADRAQLLALSRASLDSVATSTATLPRSWNRAAATSRSLSRSASWMRRGEPGDVVGDAARVPRRRGIPLVDHPREGVQHVGGLALEPLEARAGLVERQPAAVRGTAAPPTCRGCTRRRPSHPGSPPPPPTGTPPAPRPRTPVRIGGPRTPIPLLRKSARSPRAGSRSG